LNFCLSVLKPAGSLPQAFRERERASRPNTIPVFMVTPCGECQGQCCAAGSARQRLNLAVLVSQIDQRRFKLPDAAFLLFHHVLRRARDEIGIGQLGFGLGQVLFDLFHFLAEPLEFRLLVDQRAERDQHLHVALPVPLCWHTFYFGTIWLKSLSAWAES